MLRKYDISIMLRGFLFATLININLCIEPYVEPYIEL